MPRKDGRPTRADVISENARLLLALSDRQRQLDQCRRDLSQALQQNKDLYAERDRWRANAMSAYGALEDTRRMFRESLQDATANVITRESVPMPYPKRREKLPRRRQKA